MARAINHLGTAKKHAILSQGRFHSECKDLTTKELEAAKEILAEVFGITIAEVDLMIKRRSEERMQWPEKFSLE